MPDQPKACIVTGASRGIGRAIVQRLTKTGINVLAVARSADALTETASICEDHAGRCETHIADVTDAAAYRGAIDQCVKTFKRLDILVNNAGTAPLAPIATMDDATFDALNRLNINAVFYGCRAAWEHLAKNSGTIVNISSVAATDPFPGFGAYGASKAWVNLFTKALATEGKSCGIKAFAIAPGAVETTMLRGAFPEFPAERCVQPDDIAAMVEWVIDERTQYSTGQTIVVMKS